MKVRATLWSGCLRKIKVQCKREVWMVKYESGMSKTNGEGEC